MPDNQKNDDNVVEYSNVQRKSTRFMRSPYESSHGSREQVQLVGLKTAWLDVCEPRGSLLLAWYWSWESSGDLVDCS